MHIVLDSLLDGARRANGTVVVIDVFRAFTTAAVVLSRGAEKIVMTESVEEAFALREAGVGSLCMGEVDAVKVPGFDLGNSPYEASQVDVAGRTVIQRTSAGTQGIVAALAGAERLYAGALVTAPATARAVLAGRPERICLVAMGRAGLARADEDEVCAIHLRNLLEGRPGDAAAARDLILAGGQIAEFRDPEVAHMHPGDLDICLDIGRYDFAVRVTREDGRPVARMETA
ncbi:2-phosphosulfolactate phosphatase [Rhodoplanes roseus]|uniref:Probable 2-phosphosulfolactate phosphatase n=1 Tax=Rhodoplanes roseus TaxID=29409 RepID=A0A327KYM6_9BRAD|nr:2-phosphosulfolactate phosphatase [Rhodoplanes roseus]RAI43939.1 2-phosphosulfolactate phosphatase [Rhodoplanes roseus]